MPHPLKGENEANPVPDKPEVVGTSRDLKECESPRLHSDLEITTSGTTPPLTCHLELGECSTTDPDVNSYTTCDDEISDENTRDEKEVIKETSSKTEQVTPEIPETSSGRRDKGPETPVATAHDERHIMEDLVKQLQMHEDQITILQQENIKLHRRVAVLYDASENFCQELSTLWQENSEIRQEMFELWQEKNEIEVLLEDMQKTNNNNATASTRQSRKPHIFEYDPRACLKGHEIPGFKSFVDSKAQEAHFLNTYGGVAAGMIRPTFGWPSSLCEDTEASHSQSDMTQFGYGITPTMDPAKAQINEDGLYLGHVGWQGNPYAQLGGPSFERSMAQLSLEKGKNKLEDIQTRRILMPTAERAGFLDEGYNFGRGRTLVDRKRKPYSFRKDKACEIFHIARHYGLRLPESKRPDDEKYSNGPNFCLYHRVLGHTIENCYMFKDWVDRKYNKGKIPLPRHVLQNPAPH